MLPNYYLLFALLAFAIAVYSFFRGQRLARWQVFAQFLTPLYFLLVALILCPAVISIRWIRFLGIAIVISTGVVILFDLLFTAAKKIKKAVSFGNLFRGELPDYIVEICRAMESMAGRQVGGSIIIEGRKSLEEEVKAGIPFDAEVRAEVLASLFEKNSSVHDGAVIIRRGRIARVKAILPISTREELPLDIGLRHRSAIGVTEKTDAIAVIASEERKELSIAYRGNLIKTNSPKELSRLIALALKRKDIKKS